MAEKNYAFLGLGIYGMKVAETVAKTGAPVLVADSDPEKIDSISGHFASAVSLDLSNADALEEIGLEHIDTLVIDQAKNLEASIMCTMVATEAGVDYIVATASDSRGAEILKKLGVNEVVIPEEESARRLAKSLISEDFLEYTDLGEGLCVIKILVRDEWKNKRINRLKLREKYGINIIGVQEGEKLTSVFSAERVLKSGEVVVLAMQKDTMYQFV